MSCVKPKVTLQMVYALTRWLQGSAQPPEPQLLTMAVNIDLFYVIVRHVFNLCLWSHSLRERSHDMQSPEFVVS